MNLDIEMKVRWLGKENGFNWTYSKYISEEDAKEKVVLDKENWRW